ncbi:MULTISPECIES: GNAT family N-acetyltransferase [Bacillus]|uniref:GNAT family N-acetyltransferase n=1 Tax=Bacillus TaxID=1386 RepID=UPI000B5DA28E|nr:MULTISPECIES: GNAT family N-acetyltransferase [Bacillus]OXB97326.1 hypothetical protein CGQ22_18630 [Bacillus sp. M13(2017)]QCY64816.1 GNAT family N-acetyltransferase [Bacillus thuringiensis]
MSLTSELNGLKENKIHLDESKCIYTTIKKGIINNTKYWLLASNESLAKLESMHSLAKFTNSLQKKVESSEIPLKTQDLFKGKIREVLIEQNGSYDLLTYLRYEIHTKNEKIAEFMIGYYGDSEELRICTIEILENSKRNMGIGTWILRFILELGNDLQVKKISGAARPLNISDPNMCPSRLMALYEKNGFTILNKDTGDFELKL